MAARKRNLIGGDARRSEGLTLTARQMTVQGFK